MPNVALELCVRSVGKLGQFSNKVRRSGGYAASETEWKLQKYFTSRALRTDHKPPHR